MRKAMRYSISILAFICLVLSISFVSSAHSGRTDSAGGHYDRSTGEYHYHHGYPAHQHPNGVCPYESNENDSDYQDSYVSETVPWRPYAAETVLQEDTPDETIPSESIPEAPLLDDEPDPFYLGNYLFLIPLAFISGLLLFYCSIRKTDRIRTTTIDQLRADLKAETVKNKELEEQVNCANNLVHKYESDIQDLRRQFEAATQEVKKNSSNYTVNLDTLTEKEILSICGVPSGVTFDDELLPHCPNNPFVESHFSVYITSTGKCYHRIRGCCGANHKVHLFVAAGNFEPCSKCIPPAAWKYEIPDWYYRYVQLENKKFGGSKIKPYPPDFF